MKETPQRKRTSNHPLAAESPDSYEKVDMEERTSGVHQTEEDTEGAEEGSDVDEALTDGESSTGSVSHRPKFNPSELILFDGTKCGVMYRSRASGGDKEVFCGRPANTCRKHDKARVDPDRWVAETPRYYKAVCYHRVREAIASKMLQFFHIPPIFYGHFRRNYLIILKNAI